MPLALVVALLTETTAQSQQSEISQHALQYADSLQQFFESSRWENFIELSYPGVIEYYGGMNNFREYMQRARMLSSGGGQQLELVQIEHQDEQWQSVVRKSAKTIIDGKKAVVISYLVGQSTDSGQRWRYVDLADNSPENIIYIMPDIFSSLVIPQRQIVYEAFANTATNRL